MSEPSSTNEPRSRRAGWARCATFASRRTLTAAAVLCWTTSGAARALAAQRAPEHTAWRSPALLHAVRVAGSFAAPSDSSARELAREIEDLAPLEEALRGVHGLTQPQSDSLAALEQRYARVFASLAASARTLLDDASAQGLAPNVAELRSLCETVWSVRGAELLSARAMLATRAHRARFDANVAKIKYEEAELVEDVLRRSSGRMDGSART